MFRFGMGELLIVFLIILFLFGAKRLPEIARSLGTSIKEFRGVGKKAKSEIAEVVNDKADDIV